MELKVGKHVKVHGRYEDFTDHLEGCVVEIMDAVVSDQGYVLVADEHGATWYVQAEDLFDGES